MSVKHSNQEGRYAYLDRLSVEKLEKMLILISSDAENQKDKDLEELCSAIEEAILHRERQNPTGRLSNVDASWKEFVEYYATTEAEPKLFYPELYANRENKSERDSVKSENKRNYTRFIRRIAIIAAILIILFAAMAIAQAANVNLFGRLARWTDETFHFRDAFYNASETSGEEEYRSEEYALIQAEVDKCGFDRPVVPRWFPDRFKLLEILYTSDFLIDRPDAFYMKQTFVIFSSIQNERFHMNFTFYNDPASVESIRIEKDDTPVEEYVSNGQAIYVFSNLENNVATWSCDSWVVEIVGAVSMDELKRMVDSI